MATKNNIRSIRFSDELAELIDRQIGDTFTQKFENLVTKCVWELPETERRLQETREQIQHERQRLKNLHEQYGAYASALIEMGQEIRQIQQRLKEITKET